MDFVFSERKAEAVPTSSDHQNLKIAAAAKARVFSKIDSKGYFLSLNRYERKKNHKLAIEAYLLYKKRCNSRLKKLVICGGFDQGQSENLECLVELKSMVEEADKENILFITNADDFEREELIKNSKAVIYTPENEHFGIVPIEAMHCGRPVIAWNNGGPKETVISGKTGALCESLEDFVEAMFIWGKENDEEVFLKDCIDQARLFSFNSFAEQFVNCVATLKPFTSSKLE